MRSSAAGVPFLITRPWLIEMRSPGPATIRLTNSSFELRGSAAAHAWSFRGAFCALPGVGPGGRVKDDDVPDRRRGLPVGVLIDEDGVADAQGRNHALGRNPLHQRPAHVSTRRHSSDLPAAVFAHRGAGGTRPETVERGLHRHASAIVVVVDANPDDPGTGEAATPPLVEILGLRSQLLGAQPARRLRLGRWTVRKTTFDSCAHGKG